MEGISRTQASLWGSFPESCASVGTTGPPLMTTVRLAEQRLDKGSDFLDRMAGRVRSLGYRRAYSGCAVCPSRASQHPPALSGGRCARASSASSREGKQQESPRRPRPEPPPPPHRIQGGVAHLSPKRPTWVSRRRG